MFFLQLAFFAEGQKKTCNAFRIDSIPPRVDGVLDDDIWNTGEWCGDFRQLRPFENRPPSQQTQFKIYYDDNNLYVGIRCFDTSPDSIEQRMSRRDGFQGDWVEINIDSYHDLRTAFSFTITAAGVKGDEAVSNDGNNWDASWDPIWFAKTNTDELGWTAEMQIPFTQLRFGKKDEYVWGVQVNRLLFRKDERSSWQFISPKTVGWVSNFGELYGIKNITPKRQADLVPYVVGKYDKYEKEEGNPFANGDDYNGSIGLDGKIGLTNDLTLDFTVNPDFGQVEADPSEVNLSTFETFFSEKRPFFIEGKNIFNFRMTDGNGNLSSDNLFYSRRIGRSPRRSPDLGDNEYAKVPEKTTILGAFKVSGKTQKGLSIGVIECLTQKEMAEVAFDGRRRKEIAEPFTSYFAARLQKDLNNSNTRIGGMVTSTNRDLSDPLIHNEMISDAFTGGIDFNHQWKNKTYYLNLSTEFSHLRGSRTAISDLQTSSPHYFQRPDGAYLNLDSTSTNLDGFSGNIQFGRAGNGKWMYTTWLTWRSPGFNSNDIGYLRSDDELQQVFWVGFRQNEPFWIFRYLNLNLNEWYGMNFKPEPRYVGGNVNFDFGFKNYWSAGGGFSRDGKSLSTETLRGGPALVYEGSNNFWGYFQTDNRKKILFFMNYSIGIRDGQSAKEVVYSPGFNFQISDAFQVSLSARYKKYTDDIAYVNNIDSGNFQRYIRGTIHQEEVSMTIRINYYLTPDFSIQFYGMPFISAGNYSDYKYISDSRAASYESRYSSIAGNQLMYNESDEVFNVDEGVGVAYGFDKPDFNVFDFNSNLVVRWEYLPGSTVYLVWSQNRSDRVSDGRFYFNENVKDLFRIFPHNVFLLKFSYRFSL